MIFSICARTILSSGRASANARPGAARCLHFGRTSPGNEGLRRFKLGFGAREEEIRCCKYDFRAGRFVTDADRAEGWFNGIFGRLPLPLLRLAGQLLYRHVS